MKGRGKMTVDEFRKVIEDKDRCSAGSSVPGHALFLDINGNRIYVKENLEDIKTQNLPLYLDDLFERFYEIQEKFDRDCKYDKEEDIFWI